MTETIWSVIAVSLKVATASTLLGLVPATMLGYLMAKREFRGKRLLSAMTGLPLVLPPTAIGYMLLRLFAVDGPLGSERLGFNLDVLMTVKAAVIATTVMSFPLVVRTARVSFEAVDSRLIAVAQTLGHSPFAAFFYFTLPLCRRGLMAAAIIGFTRALGEFGATMTVAGNIPGKTSTLASAIWSAQEVGDREEAWILIGLSVLLGMIASLAAESLVTQRQTRRSIPGATEGHSVARGAA